MLSFEALSDEKRRKIMNAAMFLFARNGYKRTAVDDIVARAGISKGSVFYYFGSKKKFFLYLYEYAIKLTNDTVLSHLDRRDSDFFSRVWNIQQIKLCLITDYPEMYNFTAKAAEETDANVAADISRISSYYRTNVMTYALENINRARFRPDVSVESVATMLNWISEGFMRGIVCKTEADIIKNMAEFSQYTRIIEKSVYKDK